MTVISKNVFPSSSGEKYRSNAEGDEGELAPVSGRIEMLFRPGIYAPAAAARALLALAYESLRLL